MDARFPKCTSKPKPPVQKRILLPELTKTQQRPLHRTDDLEPIKRKDPLPSLVLKSAAENKAPLQKGKTIVLPDIIKTQQRPLHHAVDLKQKQEKMQMCKRYSATADVFSAFRKHLTPFERWEINQYKEVWYLGIGAKKIQGYGYDDIEGHYKMVIKDHIAYRYEVLEVIGQGTYGRVLKCRDHKTQQLVAMKVIANDQRFKDEAMAEVEILELLQKNEKHDVSNIVHMKEHFYFRNHLCITFDLMGKDLYKVMNEREFRWLDTSQVRSHAISLVQSLQFLSRTGIIHCDLKPENILVSKDDSEVIKVADFGASRLEHLNTFPVSQTLSYMSPEVILTKTFSKAIDMWSLGCILAELKTGKALFDVGDKCELLMEMKKLLGVPPKGMLRKSKLQDMLSGPRNSRSMTRCCLSMALDTKDDLFLDFIQRCLAYEPAKRMTPDEAMEHPWILEPFKRTTSSAGP